MTLLIDHQFPAIFLGAVFLGETIILSAAYLAGQGMWSITTVFWLAMLGTVLSDVAWFLFGQSIFSATKRWREKQLSSERLLKKLESITGSRPFLALLFIKFLYGTRILTIVYLSARKIRPWKFIFFDTLGTIIWLVVMLTVGWLAGRGVSNIISVVDKTEYALLVLVVIIILYRVITVWTEKRLIKK